MGALVCVLLLLPLLAACGGNGGSADTDNGEIAWDESPASSSTSELPSTPPSTPEDSANGLGGAVEFPVNLGPDDLARVKPNELGRIPILMYHAFTTNEDYLDEWTVTPEIFLQHLEWLYANDFYITPLADLINNEIEVPPGKHPVVLTFDDASSGQFRLLKDDKGAFYPDPTSAVGIMESFFDAHPDFGRGSLFAVVPLNCFQYDEEVTTCEERLLWLSEHGYEIANHTWWHENLQIVSDDLFMQQVGQTKIWIDERVPGRGNLSNVLVLPFGEWPDNQDQIHMLRNGFVYDGQDILITGVVNVAGGPSASPSSGEWTRLDIARFNTDPESWEYWTGKIESGDITMFTSDGNPATVTIPNDIPEDIAGHWDPEWASAYGMQVIRYDLPGADSEAAEADEDQAQSLLPRQRALHRRRRT
jgi:peptidoglycan/xylan/chitin deacetylase (PgdA/CDA1 family)